MSSTGIDSRRMHEEVNRCRLREQSIASRHVGHRYMLDVPTMSESCVAHSSPTHNQQDAFRIDGAILSEEDTNILTLRKRPSIESRLSESVSLSRSIGSARKYSLSDENNHATRTNYHWRRNDWTTICLFFIFLLSCATFGATDHVDCSHGLDMLGSEYFFKLSRLSSHKQYTKFLSQKVEKRYLLHI